MRRFFTRIILNVKISQSTELHIWLDCQCGCYCNLLWQRSHKMLDRTKRVGHGREREVGDGRREIRRGEMGTVSTYMDGMGQSFYLNLAWLPTSGKVDDNVYIYHSNSHLTSWVGVNGPVHVGKRRLTSETTLQYVTSLQTDEGQQCDNTSKRLL